MKTRLVAASLLILILGLAGFARADEYVIGKGDTLSIRVWGEDYLNVDVKVRPDGKISMPGVDNLTAEGLTPVQLQRRLAARLKNLVNDPMVTVMVYAPGSNTVIVYGPGVKSAVFALEGKSTLLSILARLGPDANADLDKATVERDGKILLTGLRDLYERGDATKDIELKAGDRIYVPLNENRFVYVDGAVGKPSSLPFYTGMTLLEAIHQAGGFTKFADRNDTTVIRRGKDGKPETLLVRGKDLTEKGALEQNLILQAGDMIIVKKGWF